MMQLLVLGPGCGKCVKLYDLTAQAARELGVAHELQKITDLRQIMALRVMVTPALVVNGSVKLSGKVPNLEEMKAILSQAAAAEKPGK
jgi:small redox-active disulfide protein 2